MGDVEDWEPRKKAPKKETPRRAEVKVELDPFIDCEIREVANTAHDHYYVEDPKQDPNNEMLQIMCVGCPSGCNIDSKVFKIKDGKIIKR